MASRTLGWFVLAALGTAGAATAAVAARNRGKGSLPAHQDGGYVTTRVVTVNRPMEQVREPWTDQEWLSVVLDRPVRVERLDHRRWRYLIGRSEDGTERIVEVTSGGQEATSGAPEATSGAQDGSIHWRVEAGAVAHEGRLDFRAAPGDRGTELRADLTYPQGRAEHRIRVLRGDDPDQVLRSVLRRAKSMIECGQVLSTLDEPAGRGPVAERTTRAVREKLATGGRP